MDQQTMTKMKMWVKWRLLQQGQGQRMELERV